MWWCMVLVAQLLVPCVWTWWLECKAWLGCCDDYMLCAKHWTSGGWLNAWTSISGLMAITLCAACGHAVWAVVLLGGLEQGSSLPKTCENMLCGLLEDGQRPRGLLRHGLCMCSGSYQAIPSFPNDQTCCVEARNVESRPRQHQLKVS